MTHELAMLAFRTRRVGSALREPRYCEGDRPKSIEVGTRQLPNVRARRGMLLWRRALRRRAGGLTFALVGLLGAPAIADDSGADERAIGYSVYYWVTYQYPMSGYSVIPVDGIAPTAETIGARPEGSTGPGCQPRRRTPLGRELGR